MFKSLINIIILVISVYCYLYLQYYNTSVSLNLCYSLISHCNEGKVLFRFHNNLLSSTVCGMCSALFKNWNKFYVMKIYFKILIQSIFFVLVKLFGSQNSAFYLLLIIV